jgi:GDP-D-mannose dehydratase
MPTRRALMTSVGGQESSNLAELLVAQGPEGFGLVRRPGRHPNPDLIAMLGGAALVSLRRGPAVAKARA